MNPHPAFNRTFWINIYPDGLCSGLCDTREEAVNRCTWAGDGGTQRVEVRIVEVEILREEVPLKPSR